MGMSFWKSCSCSDFVAVEITTRRPLRIAGIRYARVFPVPGPRLDQRVLVLLECLVHHFRHFELRAPKFVARMAFLQHSPGAENIGHRDGDLCFARRSFRHFAFQAD